MECLKKNMSLFKLFHDGCPYHMETSPLICSANQRTGFYMTGTSIMKELTIQKLVINSVHEKFFSGYTKVLKR